jgi:hypothetical protein
MYYLTGVWEKLGVRLLRPSRSLCPDSFTQRQFQCNFLFYVFPEDTLVQQILDFSQNQPHKVRLLIRGCMIMVVHTLWLPWTMYSLAGYTHDLTVTTNTVLLRTENTFHCQTRSFGLLLITLAGMLEARGNSCRSRLLRVLASQAQPQILSNCQECQQSVEFRGYSRCVSAACRCFCYVVATAVRLRRVLKTRRYFPADQPRTLVPVQVRARIE